jgi:hypothetical protein
MGLRATPKEELVQTLLTDEVIDAYYEASLKFNSSDLVITSTDERICVYERTKLVAHLSRNPNTPAELLEKLGDPAVEVLMYKGLSTAFWFIAELNEEDVTVCCAVSALRATGGPVS